MAANSAISQLTVYDLMTRGFFHDRIIPCLGSSALAAAIPDLIHFSEVDSKGFTVVPQRCRTARHSVPKRKLARRVLAIPNPRNQLYVCIDVEKHWPELLEACKQSDISLTVPTLSSSRALHGQYDRRAEGVERAKRSVGARYVLHADFARFYPSIYTHSIGWALHGKSKARADKYGQLLGNRLDRWIRETQDKQTGGVPVGPDTSYLIAEVIASAVDIGLKRKLGDIQGTRYIDDYHLYFASLADAEEALAALHQISGDYELDINDLKTEILELPEPIDPHWKTQLRSIVLANDDHAMSIRAIFDRAAELARLAPQDNVFTYLTKKIEAAVGKLGLTEDDWQVTEALLLRAAVGEPAALPTILRIFENHGRTPERVEDALSAICLHHAPLQQSSEVAWALWTAKRLDVSLPQEVADAVSFVDDDIVALVALDLYNNDLLPESDNGFALWSAYMTSENLYLDHWLLAYEALQQGWLPPVDGQNYVTADPFFSILGKHGVLFYDTSADVPPPESDSSDDDFEEEEDDDELDLDEEKEIGEAQDSGESDRGDAGELALDELLKQLSDQPPPNSETE
jgi:hypothetical protein